MEKKVSKTTHLVTTVILFLLLICTLLFLQPTTQHSLYIVHIIIVLGEIYALSLSILLFFKGKALSYILSFVFTLLLFMRLFKYINFAVFVVLFLIFVIILSATHKKHKTPEKVAP